MQRDQLPAPEAGLVLTHFLTARDVARARDWYADVLGGDVVLAENPAIIRVANSWIIMNPGGGPTADKPDISLEVGQATGLLEGLLADPPAGSNG